MSYNAITSRTDAASLIPEDVADEIWKNVVTESAALSLFRRVRLSRAQQRIPVLSALPTAYWVTGDTGLKQTTEMAWANKFLNVEEIAAIVPIPENVLDDTDFDMWAEIRPAVAEAIGRTFDAAVFFGVNKPASYPTDIVASAVAAGNAYARGTATSAQGGIAEDFNQVMGLVENDGYDVNGFVTRRSYRARLRGARDTTGQKLMDLSQNEIEGSPVRYSMPGMWPSGLSAAEVILGDFSRGIVGIRKDISWKLATEAVIQNGSGTIQYNLFQQDMVALRVTFRVAFEVANPINFDQLVEANRYPFAVLRSPAS